MANTEAPPPEQCPQGHPGIWVYQQTWEFYSCEYPITNDRNCKWPINKWTASPDPNDSAFVAAEGWCNLWKTAYGNA